MNEQRKVIYQRRDQILEGADLKSAAMEYLAEAVDALHRDALRQRRRRRVGPRRPGQGAEDVLADRRSPRSSSPTAATPTRCTTSSWPTPRPTTSSARPSSAPTVMREVERQVMLRIIDQRWREHLEEMDYLKEGINLRAMGQKDPLTEWQREGFEMFGVDDEGHRPGLRAVRDARPGRPARRRRPTRRRCRTCRQIVRATTHGRVGFDRGRAAPAVGRGRARRRRRPRRAPRRRHRRSSRPSSRTSGRRRRATRRARAGRARSSRCATAHA